MAKCKSCGAPLVFLKTKNGKHMPVDYSGKVMDDKRDNVQFDPSVHVSHFQTCPDAETHRKRK